jgi:GDP/UDP-N,N'-diacetylbacillosamine 2-epimerase (hydrolysing)
MSAERLRRVCFVTGTRAEFGLMRSTLEAIRVHPALHLQIIATGMHLSEAHGRTVQQIRDQGWTVDAVVPWKSSAGESGNSIATGRAMAGIAAALAKLETEVVLVVGDRVEAFAAAAAGHVGGRIIAHVHGGDRALGQVDDSLRHAITKLSHLHFPATAESEQRILNLGEDRWRVRRVGSPGVDGITRAVSQSLPGLACGKFALVVLHPTGIDESIEFKRASMVIAAIRKIGFDSIVIVYPNNDPGSSGIIQCWETLVNSSARKGGDRSMNRATVRSIPGLSGLAVKDELIVCRDIPRATFLGLMRDAAVLVGNSSSGIIEAASFGTPVVDIGPRQLGRERSENVTAVPFTSTRIERELRRIWNSGQPIRYPHKNVYGGDGAGRRIAAALANLTINDRLRRKLIAY